MILITVGSSYMEFDRLFEIVDSLCEQGVLKGEDIIAQTGNLKYNIKNFKHFSFITGDKMEVLQNKADWIICHAGTGTVIGSLKKGKKVIVFPRLKKYNEHESDHQLDLAREFSKEGYVLCAMNEAELKTAIKQIYSFSPKKFVSNSEKFCELVSSLL